MKIYKINQIIEKKELNTNIDLEIRDIQCPGGSTTCPDGNSCCDNGKGGYNCCPMPNVSVHNSFEINDIYFVQAIKRY